MKYIKVAWHHDFPDEPIVLYSEIDHERWERRKVYIFRDGRAGYANETETTGDVFLSIEPLPPLSEISSDPQFTLQEIDKQEFDNVWLKARS